MNAFRYAAHLAALLTRGPRCPWCLERHWLMGVHIDLDHADERLS